MCKSKGIENLVRRLDRWAREGLQDWSGIGKTGVSLGCG